MRLWSKREEDSADEAIPAPVGIEAIMEYSMAEGEVPEGVTIPGEETISSRRVECLKVRQPDGSWKAL
jgi:hypothetical protein